jgi:hypothetical protein
MGDIRRSEEAKNRWGELTLQESEDKVNRLEGWNSTYTGNGHYWRLMVTS